MNIKIGQDTDSETVNDNNIAHEYIAVNECGSQDYFGPLCVGAIHVTKETIPLLAFYEITTSKGLSIQQINKMSFDLHRKFQCKTVPISPKKYNEMFNSMHSQKEILAWAYATAIESLLEKVNCKYALCNRFNNTDPVLRKHLAKKERARNIILLPTNNVQNSLPLAAARIIALKNYYDCVYELNYKYASRYDEELPRGVNRNVVESAEKFIKNHGRAELINVAKISLKNI